MPSQNKFSSVGKLNSNLYDSGKMMEESQGQFIAGEMAATWVCREERLDIR